MLCMCIVALYYRHACFEFGIDEKSSCLNDP